MEIEVTEHDGIRVLKLLGHVASSEVQELTEELAKLKEVPGGQCVLDTSVLKNLPTSVIGSLIELIRHLENADGRLVLAAPTATVRLPLDRLGVSPMVKITESLDEALDLLRSESAKE